MSFFAERYATINFYENLVRDFVEELKRFHAGIYRDMIAAVDTIIPIDEGEDIDEYVERVIVKADNVDIKLKIVEGLGGMVEPSRKIVDHDVMRCVINMTKDRKPVGWVTDLRIKKALKCVGYEQHRVKMTGDGQWVWLHKLYKGPRDNHSLMVLLSIKPDNRSTSAEPAIPAGKTVVTTNGDQALARALTKNGYVRVHMTGGGYVYVSPSYTGSMKPSELRKVMEAENGNE